MESRRRTFLTIILGAASIGLAVAAFMKLFPRMMMKMMERCMTEMMKEGGEPPDFCKKMMEKCCKDNPGKSRKK